jgi:hypothetical protein
MSPPRQQANGVSGGSGKKAGKTLDGKRAGLQQATDLKDELKAIRQDSYRNLLRNTVSVP